MPRKIARGGPTCSSHRLKNSALPKPGSRVGHFSGYTPKLFGLNCEYISTIVSLDGSWSCPGTALGSRIGHSIHCTGGEQTTFKEAFSKHCYYLTKSGIPKRKFHVAGVPAQLAHYCMYVVRWCWCLFAAVLFATRSTSNELDHDTKDCLCWSIISD